MAIDFRSPSYRAASSDLTIAISPLGLVELADEEFEVHGPRLNRYSQNFAFYLGHHWGYLRELGEPQLTFNYVAALQDFINNFTFGKGVSFRSPKATSAIIPVLLQRVWEEDNKKASTLWEMGQMGGISGDCFVKVAYQEPWYDPTGYLNPGRCRILPLNSSFCFPEWYPHDRTRLARFKLKYRFWGTALEGTRQVFTYTELMTEERIEEYINDELVSSIENPLGVIPIVHIANLPMSGSPWGMSDIKDIISTQREYNEKATDISDIINYHASPITIVSGAKAGDLEKGPKKVWGGIPDKAKVYNLQMTEAFELPLGFLAQLKTYMHEATGVPENALGQDQPVSNTSGVALAIQYQPLMMRWSLKKTQYGEGIERINDLIIRTMALKEPQSLQFDPERDATLQDGQLEELDPSDPMTYRTTTHWQSPLPIDQLVALNEIQVKMGLGLQSKKGALRDLGEEFPDEKLDELQDELIEDTKRQAALDYMRAEQMSMIETVTGVPMGDGATTGQAGPQQQPSSGVTSAGGPDVNTAGQGQQVAGPLPGAQTGAQSDPLQVMTELNTLAYGTKLPQRRNPEKDND